MIHVKIDDLIQGEAQHLWDFKAMTFNGGEEHVRLTPLHYMYDNVIIEVSLTSSQKIMQLLMVTDAIKRQGFKTISLFAPYIPYARQDRVCNEGEALAIKVMCDLINAQGYEAVYTLDNHSDVATALLNNHHEINAAEIIKRMIPDLSNIALVSPDGGAIKRTYKLSKALGGIPVIECGKKRDVTNGNITETLVYSDSKTVSSFARLLIVDDICDGGRTFLGLAKGLRLYGATMIDLYVSHGIFSQGMDVFKGIIDRIYTTKSFINDVAVTREPFNERDF